MRQALELALDALTYIHTETSVDEDELIDKAITAIKEALAQPEYQSTADKSKLEKVPAKGTLLAQPEPVMHTLNCVCGAVWDIKTDGSEEMVHTPYTTPPQRKPLTDEQIEALWDNTLSEDVGITALRKITRAIEAAHGIKE